MIAIPFEKKSDSLKLSQTLITEYLWDQWIYELDKSLILCGNNNVRRKQKLQEMKKKIEDWNREKKKERAFEILNEGDHL